jgi:hypothetical protein
MTSRRKAAPNPPAPPDALPGPAPPARGSASAPRSPIRRRFRRGETDDLQSAAERGLGEEVDMLRVAIRRLFEQAYRLDDLDELIRITGALGLASTRLSRLLEAQRSLSGGGPSGELQAALTRAILDVTQEYHLGGEDGNRPEFPVDR